MSKYQSYPEYKSSNIEGVDTTPEHWSPMRFRYLFSIGRGLSITKEDLQDTGIPCVNYGEIHSKYGFELNLHKHTLRCVSEEYLGSSPGSLLRKGDFVFADTSEDMNGSGNFTQLISDDAIFAGYHTVIARVRNTKKHCDRYLAYTLDANYCRNQIRRAVKGIKVFSITQAILKDTTLLLPSLSEQKQISAFLDRETTRIDALIQKKTRFIELLKEKRQALISHVVTKGLDSKVPMKNSGVDWMGQVPKHWKIKRVKHLFQIEKRIIGHDKCQVLSITQRGIKIKDITSGEGQLSMDYAKYQIVNIGDFAMNHMDLLTGYVDISQFNGVTSPDYRVFRLIDNNSIDLYYLYLMQMGYTNRIFFGQGQGVATVGRWRFQTEPFKNFPIPYPPTGEQNDIVAFINKQTTKIEGLTQKTQHSIELLKEHRTTLISAAVTGKIDVRNHAGSINNNNLEVA